MANKLFYYNGPIQRENLSGGSQKFGGGSPLGSASSKALQVYHYGAFTMLSFGSLKDSLFQRFIFSDQLIHVLRVSF